MDPFCLILGGSITKTDIEQLLSPLLSNVKNPTLTNKQRSSLPVVDVWLLVSPWLQAFYRFPVCYEDIAYGCMQRNTTVKVNKWWAAINCVKESLRKARNVWVMRKYCVPQEIVIRSMLKTCIISPSHKLLHMKLGNEVNYII